MEVEPDQAAEAGKGGVRDGGQPVGVEVEPDQAAEAGKGSVRDGGQPVVVEGELAQAAEAGKGGVRDGGQPVGVEVEPDQAAEVGKGGVRDGGQIVFGEVNGTSVGGECRPDRAPAPQPRVDAAEPSQMTFAMCLRAVPAAGREAVWGRLRARGRKPRGQQAAE